MPRPISATGLGSLVARRVAPPPETASSFRSFASTSRAEISASRVRHTSRQSVPQTAARRGAANLTPLAYRRQISTSSSYRYSSTDTHSRPASSRTLTRSCPSCGSSVPLATSPCPSCSTLLPLRLDLSLHSLLDLSSPVAKSGAAATAAAESSIDLDIPAELAELPSLGFDLQPRSLRNTMLFRQRDLHPDKYAGAGGGGRGGGGGLSGGEMVELAKELSGRVNGAYAVLSDPLKRAEYILSVHGCPTEESDSLTDPDLLMEVLEAREELEEATTAEQVEALREANHEKVESTIASLKEALSASPPDLALAKTLTIQLRYWTGLEAAAKEWAPGKRAGLSAGSGFTHSS